MPPNKIQNTRNPIQTKPNKPGNLQTLIQALPETAGALKELAKRRSELFVGVW